MECCHPIHRLPQCMPCAPRLDMNLLTKRETVGRMLSYLFSPEASNLEHPGPGTIRPGWLGPAKALLWIGVSIAAGTALAMLCS